MNVIISVSISIICISMISIVYTIITIIIQAPEEHGSLRGEAKIGGTRCAELGGGWST